MIKNVMGIVNLQAQEELLSALTEQRPLASLPFGGRYRLIDFPMSCMVNSGIRNVGVLLPEHSRSILDHLRSGKDWDLARHHKGLFYLPPVRRAHGEQGGGRHSRSRQVVPFGGTGRAGIRSIADRHCYDCHCRCSISHIQELG